MKAICQALIILLILQSVKGRKGQKITKNVTSNPPKSTPIFLDEKSPTNCFVCRLVLDLVMQGLDTDAGKEEVQITSLLQGRLTISKVKCEIICQVITTRRVKYDS